MTDTESSFWDHLEDLRKTIIQSAVIILLTSLLSFAFYQDVLTYLGGPSADLLQEQSIGQLSQSTWKTYRIKNTGSTPTEVTIPSEAKALSLPLSGPQTVFLTAGQELSYELPEKAQLALFSPTEGMIVALRVSLWVGLVLSSPLWLFLIFRFIAPGLMPNERKLILPFIALSCCFIALGIAFALNLTVPLANRFLFHFNAALGQNLWSLSHYTSFTLVLLLGNGLAFELLVVLLFLVHLNYLTAESLTKKRRHAVIAIAILAAILTPPDVVTQFLLGAPLVGLYELTILYAKLKGRQVTELETA